MTWSLELRDPLHALSAIAPRCWLAGARGRAATLAIALALAGCSTTGPSLIETPAPGTGVVPSPATSSTPAASGRGGADARVFAPDAKAARAAEPRPLAEPRTDGRHDGRGEAARVAGEPVAPRFGPEASLWDRIRAGLAMPPLDTPLVAEKERFYLQRPDALQRMFARGGRYLFHIVEELDRRGMPMELALLPFVESAMNPVALSSAKAAGLWQFIPSTGKAYDLHQNWWVDNRRDPVHSTRAALDYLQKIHAMHGNDWFLALASYNWGEGAVARAVKRNQARGLPGDYLSLSMPQETRHYVPKLIALKNILLRADELGLTLPPVPNRPFFVTVEKTRPIDLKLAAQFAGMSVEEFVALNPAHNRPVIAASRNNELKIPADRVDGFLAALERHDTSSRPLASWQPYTLKTGETLETVAARGGVTPAEVRRANGLRPDGRLVAGTTLLVPQREVEDERRVETFIAPRVVEQVDLPATWHTVAHKDSVGSIAARYGVSVASLQALNQGLREGVKRGMRLLVRPASTQTVLTAENGARQVLASQARGSMRTVALANEPTASAASAADATAPAPARESRAPARARGVAERDAAAKARASASSRDARAPAAKRSVATTSRPAAPKAAPRPTAGGATPKPSARTSSAPKPAMTAPARPAART